MAYPERSASYRNKPAWLDRAVAEENRADGGAMTNARLAQVAPEFESAAAQDARDVAADRVAPRSRQIFPTGSLGNKLFDSEDKQRPAPEGTGSTLPYSRFRRGLKD